jgi:hypothetical protein
MLAGVLAAAPAIPSPASSGFLNLINLLLGPAISQEELPPIGANADLPAPATPQQIAHALIQAMLVKNAPPVNPNHLNPAVSAPVPVPLVLALAPPPTAILIPAKSGGTIPLPQGTPVQPKVQPPDRVPLAFGLKLTVVTPPPAVAPDPVGVPQPLSVARPVQDDHQPPPLSPDTSTAGGFSETSDNQSASDDHPAAQPAATVSAEPGIIPELPPVAAPEPVKSKTAAHEPDPVPARVSAATASSAVVAPEVRAAVVSNPAVGTGAPTLIRSVEVRIPIAAPPAQTPATAPPPSLAVADALRASESGQPTAALATAPRLAAAQEISMRIARVDAPVVDLHVVDRAGEIHVAVRTPDAALQSSLREDLGTLVNSLERSGYRAEAFTPKDAVTQKPALSDMSFQSGGRDDSRSGAGGRRQQQPPQQQPQQRQPRSANWTQTLEDAA